MKEILQALACCFLIIWIGGTLVGCEKPPDDPHEVFKGHSGIRIHEFEEYGTVCFYRGHYGALDCVKLTKEGGNGN